MPVIKRHSHFLVAVLPAALVLIAAGIAGYKILDLGYDFRRASPRVSYYVETVIEFDGHGSPVEINMSLPEVLPDQRVSDESFQSEDLRFRVTQSAHDRRGIWNASSVSGKRRIGYTATIVHDHEKYDIDSTLKVDQPLPASLGGYLLSDSMIQSSDAVVARLADSLGLNADGTMLSNIRRIYDFVTHGLRYVRFSGTTDALTAYRLGEASCGGKSRLMVALARHIGIPARLLGGKIMSAGRSTATHIWVELYINGYWVPFCPTNDYFAEVPANYLTLYYGEESFITHTRDINFKYFFNVKKRLIPAPAPQAAKDHPLEILNIWALFQRAAISVELLQIILMLPIGILVIVCFRNIIGMETFGTFMPALIAIGFRETGLFSGILLFIMIILFGWLVRWVVDHFQLLHTPRLAIILTCVITFILGITTAGLMFGLSDFARAALFPIVILTLTVERFSILSEEHGIVKAITISASTLLVTSLTYGIMSNRSLQAVVVSFPEILLLVVALLIYMGRYSGFRLLEFVRFKDLLRRT